MTTYEYVTAPTGTVHMCRPFQPRTLCGRHGRDWTMGDETISGLAATCERCRSILDADHRAGR